MPNYKVTDKVTGKSFVFNWTGKGKPTGADLDNIARQRRETQKLAQTEPKLTLGQKLATSIPEPVVDVLRPIGQFAELANRPLLPESNMEPGVARDIYEGAVRPISSPVGIALAAGSGGIANLIRGGRTLLPAALAATGAAATAPAIGDIPELVRGELSPDEARDTLLGTGFTALGGAGAIAGIRPRPITYTGEEGVGILRDTVPVNRQLGTGQKQITARPLDEYAPDITEGIVNPPSPLALPPAQGFRPTRPVSPEGEVLPTTDLPITRPQDRPIQFQPKDYELPVNLEAGEVFDRPDILGGSTRIADIATRPTEYPLVRLADERTTPSVNRPVLNEAIQEMRRVTDEIPHDLDIADAGVLKMPEILKQEIKSGESENVKTPLDTETPKIETVQETPTTTKKFKFNAKKEEPKVEVPPESNVVETVDKITEGVKTVAERDDLDARMREVQAEIDRIQALKSGLTRQAGQINEVIAANERDLARAKMVGRGKQFQERTTEMKPPSGFERRGVVNQAKFNKPVEPKVELPKETPEPTVKLPEQKSKFSFKKKEEAPKVTLPEQKQKPQVFKSFQELGKEKPNAYKNNMDLINPQRSPRGEIYAAIKAGVKSGVDRATITNDLMSKGFSKAAAEKLIIDAAKGSQGTTLRSGFNPVEAVRETKNLIEDTYKWLRRGKETADPQTKQILDSIEKNLDDYKHKGWFDYAKGPEFVIGEKMGVYGKQLQTHLDRALQAASEVVGDAKARYHSSQLPKLSKEEFINFHKMLTENAKAASPKVQQAYDSWVEINNSLAQEAKKVGLLLKTKGGKTVEFREYNPKEYFPRYLTKEAKALRKSLLEQIVDEEKVTFAKAQDILNDPKSPYFAKAQHQRVNVQEKGNYRIEPEVLLQHIEELGHRIGIAKELGPKDIYGSKMNALFDKIRADKGGAAVKEALDTVRKFTRPDIKQRTQGEQRVRNFLSSVATARYLPAFFWTNVSNALLLPVKGTNTGLMRGTAKYLFQMEASRQRAMKGGSLEQLSKIEYAPAKDLVSNTVGRIIDLSERNIRTWANEIGRETAADLFKNLKGNLKPKTRQIMERRLENLILEKPDLTKSGLSEAQLRRAGFQMVKDTQGIVSPLSIPKKWQDSNFVVDQMLMFKRYAGIQTGNVIRAIKENPNKAIPTLGVTAGILGEVVGDGLALMKGAIAGAITDDTVSNAIEREIGKERGAFIAQRLRTFGLSEEESQIAGRFIDNANRAFVLGLVGDFFSRIISGPRELTTGLMPGIDIVTEVVYDALRLLSAVDEDVTLEEAAEPAIKSLVRSTPIAGSAVVRSMEESEPKINPYAPLF